MFKIVLCNPQIAPNTGNIMRLCANTGCTLSLIKPYGFTLDEKRLRRAGLDYHEFAEVTEYNSFTEAVTNEQGKIWLFSTKGTVLDHKVKFNPGDVFVFGSETAGVSNEVFNTFPKEHIVRLPMLAHSRSLNLSNTVAIGVYLAWQQCEFRGGID